LPYIDSITVRGDGTTANFNAVAGDSLYLRHTASEERPILVDVAFGAQSVDTIIRSPRLHDPKRPIEIMNSQLAQSVLPRLPKQLLYPGQNLIWDAPGGGPILTTDFAALVVVYPTLVNALPNKFMSWATLEDRFVNWKTLQFQVVTTGTAYTAVSLATLGENFSDFKSGKQYALVGYDFNTNITPGSLFVRIQNDDTSRFKILMFTDSEMENMRNYFYRLSLDNNMDLIPVFDGINMSTIALDALGANAATFNGTLFFAELL